MKKRERDVIADMFRSIEKSKDKRYLFKKKHPVTDIRDMLRQSAEKNPDEPLFMVKRTPDAPFEIITFSHALEDVNALGTAMMDLGLSEEHIGIIGKNSPEWAEAYLAVTGGVGVAVPLDRELNERELSQLAVKGDIAAVITAGQKYRESFLRIKREEKTRIRWIIDASPDEEDRPEEGVLSWEGLVDKGRSLLAGGDRSYEDAQIINTEPAVIIFTSGTTGVSKGVMLSSKNLVLDAALCQTMFEVKPGDICYSVLPLHHAYEATATFLTCVYNGACIAFSRGLKYIAKDMAEVEPTVMIAVPAIIENFYRKIIRTINERLGGGTAAKVLLKAAEKNLIGIKLPKKIRKGVRAAFGGELRGIVSGGAAIDPVILDFFCSAGINAVQGYGLSECSPIVALNPDKRKYIKNASAGHLLPFVECRIDDADENGIGEICFRGPVIMMGYYKDPEKTVEAIDTEGWFHTGDLGYLDRDDYVFITGRKKSVIITDNGKNVYPEELEGYLAESPYIAESMVWGADVDPKVEWNGIVATVRPDEEAVRERLADAYTEQAETELIEGEVDRINSRQPGFKKIHHVVIRRREFDKTTALKIRRFVEDNKRS